MEAEPRNSASDIIRTVYPGLGRLADALPGELEQGRKIFAEGFTREDRRKFIAVPTQDADGVLDSFRAYWDLGAGPPTFVVSEIVGVRGDRLVLFRATVEFGDDQSTESLTLIAFSSGMRITKAVVFDAEDLDTALAELERLHAELGPGEGRFGAG